LAFLNDEEYMCEVIYTLPLSKQAIDWDFIPEVMKPSMKNVIDLEVKKFTKYRVAFQTKVGANNQDLYIPANAGL
jgi:hypothetical protein